MVPLMTRLLALLAIAAFSVAWSAWVGSGLAGFVETKLETFLEMVK